MMRIYLVAIVSVMLVLSLGLVAACGGDDALSEEEYFAKLTELDKVADEAGDEPSGDGDPTVGQIADTFTEIANDYISGLEDIKPPEDLEDEHQELIDAIKEFAETIPGVRDDLGDDAPGEEFFGEIDFERADAAFCALQKVADDKGIEADVGCEEGDGGVDPSTLPAEEATEVLIEDFSFQPAHIQVSVGDTVTWTQGADDALHTVTADDESFDSDNLSDEGDTFESTFERAGEFSYFCSIHPEMLGLVTVLE